MNPGVSATLQRVLARFVSVPLWAACRVFLKSPALGAGRRSVMRDDALDQTVVADLATVRGENAERVRIWC